MLSFTYLVYMSSLLKMITSQSEKLQLTYYMAEKPRQENTRHLYASRMIHSS